MPDDSLSSRPRRTQPEALATIARRLARADQPPWLHGEVARRMAERLALVRLQPGTLVDWWSFNGASRDALQRAYPRARVLQVEHDHARPRGAPPAAAPWWSKRRWAAPPVEAVQPQELQPGGADLLWANMLLHLIDDPLGLMRQWHQALAVDGLLMFSTLGPGSLAGLRRIYDAQRWPSPHAAFIDMHDLGDMLLQCGFADPVMDQETLTLTWPDADALLRELRTLGGNADPARVAGLRTPRWRGRLRAALESLRGPDGRLRLDFELVYGHAWRAAPKPRVAAQTSVALDQMRAMVRAGRGAPASDAGPADG